MIIKSFQSFKKKQLLAVVTWASCQRDHYIHVFSVFLHLVYFEFQFHYKQEGSYSIGTVGWVDEDCDFVDFTYVSVGLRNKNDKFLPSEYQEYCDRRHCIVLIIY